MALIIDPANDATFCNSVRRLLGGVDEDTLPDEDIIDPSIFDVAELKVIDLVPDYDSLSDPDKAKVRLAVIHVVASLLCPSMASRVDVEVRTIDTSWKRKSVDYDVLAETLLARAYELLHNLVSVGDNSKVFAVAPSKRAVTEIYEE